MPGVTDPSETAWSMWPAKPLSDPTGQRLGLVVSALPASTPMERDRDHQRGSTTHLITQIGPVTLDPEVGQDTGQPGVGGRLQEEAGLSERTVIPTEAEHSLERQGLAGTGVAGRRLGGEGADRHRATLATRALGVDLPGGGQAFQVEPLDASGLGWSSMLGDGVWLGVEQFVEGMEEPSRRLNDAHRRHPRRTADPRPSSRVGTRGGCYGRGPGAI